MIHFSSRMLRCFAGFCGSAAAIRSFCSVRAAPARPPTSATRRRTDHQTARSVSRVLEVAAQSNGTIINYAKLARDVGADPKTIISYFSILEDTLVGFHLPAYHRSIRKQQRTNPKFYYFDVGVKRSLERTLEVPLRAGTCEFGKAFEHFVITQILHLSRYRCPDWRLFYLQTGAGVEIDLLVERPAMPVVLIEIKSSDRIDERDTRGLARFMGDFGRPLALCLSRDPARMRIDGVLCLHWREVLLELGLREAAASRQRVTE